MTTIDIADAPRRQARNSAAYWAATARSRGHEIVVRRAFLAAVGDERAGTRFLLQEPDLTPAELAELTELAAKARARGPVDAEDPYSATDLSALDLTSFQMPVMLRQPGPVAAPAMEIRRVASDDDLFAAERAVIEGFELVRFEPHRPGEMFPRALLSEPGVAVHVAVLDGSVAGACVSVVDGGLGSHYWVGTPAAFRSRGVGRAVMLGSLAEMTSIPATLTASKLGRPLYESLGYEVAGMSTWWRMP